MTATVFVLLLPAGVPLWHLALALSLSLLGLVFGDLIFGDRGHAPEPGNSRSGILLFSFPDLAPNHPG
ncbi:MAG: hypothetical protein IPF96_20195 [Rhodobacter sp.]|nr:hypothetical protein [Rhodobacter sp.]